MNKVAIILAGGKGSRMKSAYPKVLSEVLFKPMLGYVIEACINADIKSVCVITGYKSELVCDYLEDLQEQYKDCSITTAYQAEQKGTGHAVMCAEDFIKANINSQIAILTGDAPFVDADTLINSYDMHSAEKNAVTIITAKVDNPTGYGRILRDENKVVGIKEHKDCNDVELSIDEINSGGYWFNADRLSFALKNITTDNSQGEYYLTDTVKILANENVGGYICQNPDIVLGANSRKDLYDLTQKLNNSIIAKHMENGVEFVSTDAVLISSDAVIGSDTKIYPGTVIKQGVTIGSDCVIGPNTLIEKSSIGDFVKLNSVQCYESTIESDADIGPFVHIRPNSHIKSHVHIGDFVEVKNSVIGEGTGISHLTYVGDSDVGRNVNFGCGVVTVNYDGVNKNRCTIEDEAFIGCNTNLIAPVTVGKSAYTAAGSTITKNVPDLALGIARASQNNKENFAKNKLAGRKLKFTENE